MNSLPNDCLGEIIPHVVTYSGRDYVSFIRARIVVCSLNRNWRTVALATHSIWRHITLTQHVPVEVLRFWMAKSGSTKLKVEVVFRDLQRYYPHGDPSNRICSYARSVLPILLPSVARWTSLSLHIEDKSCARLFVLALQQCNGSSIVNLSLDCPFLVVEPPATTSNLPFHIFLPGNIQMYRLSLKGGAAGWSLPYCFQHLVYLDVRGTGKTDSLQFTELLTVLRVSVMLQRLSVGVVDVGDGQHVTPSIDNLVHLPALRTLELVDGMDVGALALVGWLVVPLLSKMVLDLDSNSGPYFDNPEPARDILCGVSSLVIRTKELQTSFSKYAKSFFAPFSSVVKLDLTDADPLVLQSLVQSSLDGENKGSSSDPPLPMLDSLAMSGEALDSMLAFLEIRMQAPVKSLRNLQVHFASVGHQDAVYATSDWRRIVMYVMTRPRIVDAAPVGRFSICEMESAL
ncbi:hypothetical protein C8R43DRAFT_964579 [Mycena crocata]|nr:hypothetical protein C8R43DRAFT_964579 [Mycena crocata]